MPTEQILYLSTQFLRVFFSPDKLWRGDQISDYISILTFSIRGYAGSGPQCPATWQLHLIICQPENLTIFFLVKLSLDRLPSNPTLFTKDMHEFWLNMADCSKYFEGRPYLSVFCWFWLEFLLYYFFLFVPFNFIPLLFYSSETLFLQGVLNKPFIALSAI